MTEQATAQAAPQESVRKDVIYVADPMCSWCWGFSPVIQAIGRQIEAYVPQPGERKPTLTPVMGGLRPLTRQAMSDDDKAKISHHWQEVAQRSGQPFDMTFFERDGFVYDTEPACRAVCLVRKLRPDAVMGFLERIQRAFYAQGSDITDTDILAALANEAAGLEPDLFRSQFTDVAMAYETSGDFHAARQLGVTGYPTVILQNGNQLALLTQGYQGYDALKDAIGNWLNGTLETQPTA